MKNKASPQKRLRGSISFLALGIISVVLLFGLIFLELEELYDCQYAVEVRAQRAVNSCVEYYMDDMKRADYLNYLDVDAIQHAGWPKPLYSYLNEDLNVDSSGKCYDSTGKLLYTVSYSNPQYTENPATMGVTVTVRMQASIGSLFNFPVYTWSNDFKSTNFRTDVNERAGRW